MLSVIVPCFNEEEVIEHTNERLARALSDITPDYEIIYVDDGSRDGRLNCFTGSNRQRQGPGASSFPQFRPSDRGHRRASNMRAAMRSC
jgi:cellulose synthase/poly-beta-1,6-N-acetylglucosamine synthase-like glycosyltransferase